MVLTHYNLIVLVVLLPLLAAILAGCMPKKIPKSFSHQVTICGVALSFVFSLLLAKSFVWDALPAERIFFYTWGISGSFQFHLGFLLDSLSSLMLVIVTLVALLVHIYSIGYMDGDPGYRRFFAYIAFFTSMMLFLVSADNFLQLYFGWEGVGLASYLLIGFWFKKESANNSSLKAFLLNRVGDFGFLLGMATILNYFGTLDFGHVFSEAPTLIHTTMQVTPWLHWSVLTVICILLFIGAMGKSAQVPLHVWLPDSMEGPTPISALIHAATMVTAGVYMVARMSPLFEYSSTALSVVLIIGATSAFFIGILALVQNDIKRIIAYSTISQLGYMIAALGASAYAAGIFHLLTHACFKALLFLTAGSVIIALHHEQDIRKMGNLYRYLPITYVTFLLGALALSAIPPFAGFYSKDAIIASVHQSHLFGAHYAYVCLLLGAFVTALYTFRMFFLVFHSNERLDPTIKPVSEPRWVMWLPSVILAIPSVALGWFLFEPMLMKNGWLANATRVLPIHQTAEASLNPLTALLLCWQEPSFWFALLGILAAWISVMKYPYFDERLAKRFAWTHRLLLHKYGFDAFNQWVFVRGGKRLASFLFNVADLQWLDGYIVNGTGRLVNRISLKLRQLQSGYLYHYAFAMILGILVLLAALLFLEIFNV
jgi:NADH-quinone oxidoreductase subunit L